MVDAACKKNGPSRSKILTGISVETLNNSEKFYGYLNRGEYQRLRDLIRLAIRRDPWNPLLFSSLAGTYEHEEKYKMAFKYYEKALELSPLHPEILVRYGEALHSSGNPGAATKIWKKVMRRGEGSLASGKWGMGTKEARSLLNYLRMAIGLGYYASGNIHSAIRYVESHIRHRTPGIRSVWTLNEAKNILALFRQSTSSHGRLLVDSFRECFDQGEYKKARDLLRKELKVDPDDHWLITCMSETYYKEGKYRVALEYSEKAFAISPRCPRALWNHAEALYMTGREKEAIAIYKKLLKRSEESIAYGPCGEGMGYARSCRNDARFRIALSYDELGKTELAIRYLKTHISHRARGVRSDWTRKETKQLLVEFEAKR